LNRARLNKKRVPRKRPLSLYPLSVDEALAISLGAGPLPEKAQKRAKNGARKRTANSEQRSESRIQPQNEATRDGGAP
jgi:hypothetical protein